MTWTLVLSFSFQSDKMKRFRESDEFEQVSLVQIKRSRLETDSQSKKGGFMTLENLKKMLVISYVLCNCEVHKPVVRKSQ